MAETIPRCQVKKTLTILSSLILLVSCAPSMPIYIQDIWVSEPPTVGEIVRLSKKVTTIGDEENIVLTLKFPPTIAALESLSRWEFGLKNKSEKEIFTDICVLESGTWIIDVGIASLDVVGETRYGDLTAIGVISDPSEAMVLMEKDITYSLAEETQRPSNEVVKVSIDDCSC